MQGSVTLGSYVVPITTILTVLGLLVGIGLAVLFALTLGLSSYYQVRTTRRERMQSGVQNTLLSRAFSPEPDWDDWVDDLSETERTVAIDPLAEYLREPDGSEADSLKSLGKELGIPACAQNELELGHTYERLQALTWLIRLDTPEPYHDASYEPKTPAERAAVARLLFQTEQLERPEQGIELMLNGATKEFSVFGQVRCIDWLILSAESS